MSFACPLCHWRSAHPRDQAEGYCGHCHAFTGKDCHIIRITAPNFVAGAICCRAAGDALTATPPILGKFHGGPGSALIRWANTKDFKVELIPLVGPSHAHEEKPS